MRLLLIGDIVGKPGRRMVTKAVNYLKESQQIDMVVANAENAAGGSGITPENYRELIAAGVDCITLGDHIYRRREIYSILDDPATPIVKPANFPPEAPGKDWVAITLSSGIRVAVFSLLGRVFMRPVDCPWKAAERILREIPDDIQVILCDFHAEATSDMQLMGRYLDGRVSAVLGTHTHVPTADERILPKGTAFQCDVGMTGSLDSILGRKVDPVMETTITFRPAFFDVAQEQVQLCATLVEVDPSNGKAIDIRRISLAEEEVDANWNK
ncbi:MAG: TIGR00282 family metallophosphoesterase [Pirellulaceae bacterium]